jgi:hypothetical protein
MHRTRKSHDSAPACQGMSLVALAILMLGRLASFCAADSPSTADSSCTAPVERENSAAAEPGEIMDDQELAVYIDAQLAAVWEKAKIVPAPRADDAEYLRRAHLDLVGKIPSVAELQDFLADNRPDKRIRVVEELLHRGAYAQHFANTWRNSMLSGTPENVASEQLLRQFQTWLRLRFTVNMPYDRLVSDLLTEPLDVQTMQPTMMATQRFVPTPAAFFQANELKREQIAASASRFFLGVQVQCAQCHDHPFSHWKQREFWSLAAFFDTSAPGVATLKATSGSSNAIQIPDTDITVEPAYLDGTQPDWTSGADKRALLAGWMTQADNPYFAKAAINRLWDHFLGRGFVHPVDDLDPANPPSHPQLLEEMSRQFVLHGYDLKYVIRAIMQSRAYQLTSRSAGTAEDDLPYFARMPVRRMTSDQLFQSIVQATGFREPRRLARPGAPLPEMATAADAFRSRFADSAVPRTEAETSILQALALMNGKLTSDATDLQSSETLLAVTEAPFLDVPEQVEMLFMATLSRQPTVEESQELVTYVQAGDSKSSLADVFWALLNSAEFALNH